jgi:hypothetical protein
MAWISGARKDVASRMRVMRFSNSASRERDSALELSSVQRREAY